MLLVNAVNTEGRPLEIFVKDGRIAEIGTHQELMRTCEIYREIVLSQLSEQEATQNGR